MQPLIENKAELLHLLRNCSNPDDIPDLKLHLKLATKAVKDWTEIAKNLWAKKLANEVNGINITPKQTWRAAYEIRDGVKGHHVKPVAKRFRNTNGTLANSPSENASIVEAHCNRVLNTQRPVADNAVELIRQRETVPEPGLPPTWTEFKRAVFKLKNDKQPGSNVVLANAFKCLDSHNLTILYNFILLTFGMVTKTTANGMKASEL